MAVQGGITVNEISVLEVNTDPSVSGAEAPIGSLAIIDSGGGVWQKFGSLDTDWAPVSLKQKSGSVPANYFSGSPQKYTVLFASTYPTTSYSVTLSGSDSRSWVAENLTASGFDINTQASQPLTGLVYWQSQYKGET